MFREYILDNVTSTEAECRLVMAERASRCYAGVCRQCTAECLYEWARVASSILKCGDVTRHMGYLHFTHTSDAGQLARSMHGAIRKDNWIANPEKLAAVSCALLLAAFASLSAKLCARTAASQHNYAIGHQNPKGYVQRDGTLAIPPSPRTCRTRRSWHEHKLNYGNQRVVTK